MLIRSTSKYNNMYISFFFFFIAPAQYPPPDLLPYPRASKFVMEQLLQNPLLLLCRCICINIFMGTAPAYRWKFHHPIAAPFRFHHWGPFIEPHPLRPAIEPPLPPLVLTLSGSQIKYVPLALAMGICPDEPQSFFMQQYRWCKGSATLVREKEFWQSNISRIHKLCFLNGMLYYMATALVRSGRRGRKACLPVSPPVRLSVLRGRLLGFLF